MQSDTKSIPQPPKNSPGTARDSSAESSHGDISVCQEETRDEEKRTMNNVLDANEDPKQFASARKWLIVGVISASSMCATCASSLASFAEAGVEKSFNVSHTVSILAISLFVMGLGTGPLVVGPLSEVYGRTPIYRVSFALFTAFSFPVAFAPDIAVFLIFRFVTGLCGAAFLSVAGGSVSDLFTNETVATPMAVYTASPFLGPIVGPLISGFINQHTHWRWTYYLLIIWSGVQTLLIFLFVPETYTPVLLKRQARRMSKNSRKDFDEANDKSTEKNLMHSILVSCYKPFQLILYERMVLLLNIWNSLLLGILYLAFQAFPVIFKKHNFNMQEIGMSFLGIGVGMAISLACQPFWNRLYIRTAAKHGGQLPPETRLISGMLGGILVPVSLYWLAFTTYKSVHWIVPIIASAPFGAGTILIFTSCWTYLVTLYRPWAASVMASNSFMRSCFAAAFPLFAGPMYNKLGTVGATALLAGLCTIMTPLPFIFYRLGPRIRETSRFAA